MSGEETSRCEKLAEENLGLVHSCCHKMKGRGIEYEDLFSAGCIGLVKASKRFDATLGYRFSTYAVPVIFGEIKLLFRENNPVKVSRSLKELSLKAARTREALSNKLNREPTVSELAEALQVSAEEISEAISASSPPVSLTSGEDGGRENEVAIEGIEEKVITAVSIEQLLNSLEEKDKKLIKLRFFAEKTQTQAAKLLGMSQVQVSRREKFLLITLRKKFIC